MRKLIPFFLIFNLFVFSNLGFAEFDTYKASPWTEKTTYSDKALGKLGFGLLNLTAGWSAILYEVDAHKKTNPYTGLLKGIYRSLANTFGGAAQTLTFPIMKDIPLPDGGVHFTEE